MKSSVNYYAAPMEGLTGYTWRRAQRQCFGGADAYFTPFINPTQNYSFQPRDLRELSHEESDLVPQLLVNRADYFICAAKILKDMGYTRVNLNMGCPSGTVVSKGKGSGLLKDAAKLDILLNDIFEALPDMEVSIKTRIGLERPDEWPAIFEVISRYPVSELIVHPRVKKQMYQGTADRPLFLKTLESSRIFLVYNGDITDTADEAFTWNCSLMAGRGLVGDPALFRRAKGGSPASRKELTDYHELMVEGCREYLSGENPLVHRLREMWHCFSMSFSDCEPYIKQINKARNFRDYYAAAQGILQNCPLNNGFRE